MQLIYLYIKRFRNLKDVSVPLSPAYIVQYDPDKQMLVVTNGKAEIAQMLYGEHISSVHAIVGRNAVGKTNLTDVIALPRKDRNEEKIWNGIGMDEDGDGAPAYFLLYADGAEANGSLRYCVEYRGNIAPAADGDNGQLQTRWIRREGERWVACDPPAPVRRTRIISLREEFNEQYYTLSARNGAARSYFNEDKDKNVRADETAPPLRSGGIYTFGHFGDEAAVLNKLRDLLHVDEAQSENATLLSDSTYGVAITWDHSVRLNSNLFPGITEAALDALPPLRRFIFHILCRILLPNIQMDPTTWVAWESSEHSLHHLLQNACEAEDGAGSLFVASIATFLEHTLPKIFISGLNESQIKWFHALITALEDMPEHILQCRGDGLYVPVHPTPEQFENYDFPLYNLLETCSQENNGILRCVWLNTSDGERHLMQGFASLYRLLDEVGILDGEAHPVSSCILLLDEPELHSHPELARCFLWYLTRWLGNVTPKDQNGKPMVRYQIILTTHSPFLLSDVDRDHTLLCRRSPKNTVTVGPPAHETFAANIHDILCDSIFLDHPFGAAAFETLQHLMCRLEENGQNSLSPDERNIIGQIGEPVLRGAFVQFLREHAQDKI